MKDNRHTLWKLLNDEQYLRLCECRSIKEDFLPLTKCFLVHYNSSAEDAVARTFDHLDCNSQWFDITKEEYDDLIYELTNFDKIRKGLYDEVK